MTDTAIIVRHGNETMHLSAAPDETLERTLFVAGMFRGLPLCSGMGKCGLCRVRFVSAAPEPREAEQKKLSGAHLAEGWRLSCLHPARPCEVEVPVRQRRKAPAILPADVDADGGLSLAVDLGTTGLHWRALQGGRRVASGREMNPQMGLGSEVMSRLAYGASEGGRRTLSRLVSERLEALCEGLGTVKELCICGNPAMISLLLQQDVSGLSRAPYALPDACGGLRRIPDSSLPPAYIPPHFAPFVGADLSAGLAALVCSRTPPPYPFVLADMGTNGEFLLALSPEDILVASVPLGPALEGVGLSFGRAASPGSVCRFELTPAGLGTLPCEDTDDASEVEEAGISGTGYLSLVALLLRHGLLDRSGRFAAGTTPMAARLGRGLFDLHGEAALRLPGTERSAAAMQHLRGPQAAAAAPATQGEGMYLAASDVEELIKVKAAFNLALTRLCAEADLSPQDLGALCLAGALGRHVNVADLETLGFLPRNAARLVHKVGNTSLDGAELLLASPDARRYVESLPAPRVLDPASSPDFAQSYVTRMVFDHV